MAEVTVTTENFNKEVVESDKPVLLDFWATWCGPCKMITPNVAKVAEEHPEIKVGKVNVDEQMDLAQKFGVASIPTLVVVNGGNEVKRSVGYLSKKQIEDLIQ